MEDVGGESSSVATTAAPADVREVTAEGRAAIGEGGVIAARKAAEAQALRNAVEKTTGVYVGARTLTQNYALVRDQVVTRSAGFATLKEIVRESVGTQEVRVTVRALVSLKPLAEQLKALNLTRSWRVYVAPSNESALTAAQTDLELALTEAGFVVVSAPTEADVTISLRPAFSSLAETRLTTTAGPMTMHSIRSEVTLRAVRTQTGEVVAGLSSSATALHINVATARAESSRNAMKALAPRLTESLLLLPARESQPVSLAVARIKGIGDVEKIEEALGRVTGVREVTRRSWTGGVAVWELDVFTEAQSALAHALEASDPMRPFHLAVDSETRAKITAIVTPPVQATAKRKVKRG